MGKDRQALEFGICSGIFLLVGQHRCPVLACCVCVPSEGGGGAVSAKWHTRVCKREQFPPGRLLLILKSNNKKSVHVLVRAIAVLQSVLVHAGHTGAPNHRDIT